LARATVSSPFGEASCGVSGALRDVLRQSSEQLARGAGPASCFETHRSATPARVIPAE